MAASAGGDYPWKEPTTSVARGAFIVIEGLDRAGKTTQVKKLCDSLYDAGHNVQTLRFPDRTTPIGTMIDSYLQSKTDMDDHSIHLLFSANRWEKASWIRDTIRKGYTIICDRYYYSGMIYSAAKQNPELSLEWAKSPDIGLPRPDAVVFLNLSPEDAERRGGYGEEKYEKKEMQQRVRQLFLDLEHVRHDEAVDMRVVDAGSSLDQVAKLVYSEAIITVNAVEGGQARGPLGVVRVWPEGTVERVPLVRKRSENGELTVEEHLKASIRKGHTKYNPETGELLVKSWVAGDSSA